MSLISRAIPNLINGVSQQPEALRLSSQGESQVNGFSSVVEGLSKRPPTEHVAKLITGTLVSPYIHLVNRSLSERFSVIVTADQIRVFDLDGTARTVNYADFVDTSLSAVAAVGDGTAYRIYIPTGTSTISLATSGITTATVLWEKSSTGAFAGEETTVRTDTSDTDATVAWTSGDYIRASVSAWTAGTITATVTSKKINYLQAALPRTDVRALTIADYTFVLNKTVAPAMKVDTTTKLNASEGLVFVKVAEHNKTYDIIVDGVVEATYTTAATGAISTEAIATNLAADLVTNLGGGWTIDREHSTIHIIEDNDTAFTLQIEDDAGGVLMKTFKDKVQRFTDLPTVAPTDYAVEVLGDPSSAFDNYYVKFQPDNPTLLFDRGVWVETVAPNVAYILDPETMPHSLVREADATFTFGAQTWGNRVAGDMTSAPNPSFVGNTINDMFFYRNRLGFLADTNVILSEASSFFNFFPTTVTTILDAQPIDIAASHVKVPILQHAVPFNEDLLVFSDLTQFVLTASGDNNLTVSTVQLDVVTEYETSNSARPLNAGKNLYFGADNGSFSRIREYFVDGNTGVNDAVDVTAPVPKYVPANVVKFALVAPESVLVALSDDAPTNLYTYQFFFQNNQKVQSAWHKWSFNGATILDVGTIGSVFYITAQYDDGVYLMKMDTSPGRVDNANSPYLSLLDRRVDETQLAAPSFDAMTGKTTWTLPYNVNSGATMQVITRQATTEIPGVILQGVTTGTATVSANGDHTSTKVYIGEQYEFRYRFSKQVLKEKVKDQGGERVLGQGRLQIRTWSLVFDNTGFFQLEVTPEHTGEKSTYPFGAALGTGEVVLGVPTIADGTMKRLVMAKNDEVLIEIANSTHLPCHFVSADWEGWFTMRSKRF